MRGGWGFVLGMALVLLAASAASARMVSINGEKVRMRSGPGTSYKTVYELGKGYPLRVVGSKGSWLKVVDFENDTGWIYTKLVGKVPYMVVKKKRINIRSGPGAKYRMVGQANYGVVFRTLDRRRGWVKVKHESGLSGWVMRDLLWGW